jgi:hypothetical protein
MKASDANRIRYADTQADIANAWKKWQGETLGMAKADAIRKKEETEDRYRNYFTSKGAEGKAYLDALENLRLEYKVMNRLTLPAQYQGEAVNSVSLFSIISLSKGLLQKALKATSPEEKSKALQEYKAAVRSIWKDSDPKVERELFTVCMKAYNEDLPKDLQPFDLQEMLEINPMENGKFTKAHFDKANCFDSVAVWQMADRLSKGDSSQFKRNPAYRLWKVLNEHYFAITLPQYQRANAVVEENQKVFFKGLMEMDKDKNFYPDANQTFRIAFGKVSGYQPKDGARYGFSTTSQGILEKAGTADDFMMTPELENKFRNQTSPIPVAFIASNHSTGGNSGSPVLNGKGELIGLNFDRVWEGTMSDYFFDSRICRNISCDIRYVLWVIENVGGNKRLIQEMELRN